MKKLPNNLTYTVEAETATLYGKLRTGKRALFGTCHAATIPLIKRDGVNAHLPLIRLASSSQQPVPVPVEP